MKRTAIFSLGLACLLALTTGPAAQEKAAPLAARYQPIEKTKYTRLLHVYGSPEVAPGFGQSNTYAANGKVAVFANNVPDADPEATPNSQLIVWDLEQRVVRKEISIAGRYIIGVALTGDGKTALLGMTTVDAKSRQASPFLALWDLVTGREIRSFGKTVLSLCLAISPDGTHALAGTDVSAAQWDLKQGKALVPFKIPAFKAVEAVAYLPDGKRALCAWDGEIRLWELASGKEKRAYQYKPPRVQVIALAVSSDGKHFAAATRDYSVTVWETDTGKECGSWRRKNIPPTLVSASAELALAEDGTTVVACWGGFNPGSNLPGTAFVCRFDGITSKEAWSKEVPMQGAVPMRLAGNSLILGGGANPFREWQFADGKEMRTWGGHKGPVTALARGAAGAILSAGNEGVLFLSGGPHKSQVTAWRAHDAAINAMAARDGRLLTASADKTAKLHDVAKRTTLATLRGHTGNVTSVAFGPAGAWAASGSDDRTIILWDLKAGKKRQALEGHADAVNGIAVAPAGDWLASAGSDNTVRLWPIKDGALDADRDPVVLEGHTRPVLCVAFSPDGKQLLSAGQDQTVKLWDVAEQKLAHELKGHSNWISAAAYYGRDRILSASDDLTVRLWDARKGAELDRIDLATIQDGPRSLVALGPDQFAVGTSGWLVLRFASPAAR